MFVSPDAALVGPGAVVPGQRGARFQAPAAEGRSEGRVDLEIGGDRPSRFRQGPVAADGPHRVARDDDDLARGRRLPRGTFGAEVRTRAGRRQRDLSFRSIFLLARSPARRGLVVLAAGQLLVEAERPFPRCLRRAQCLDRPFQVGLVERRCPSPLLPRTREVFLRRREARPRTGHAALGTLRAPEWQIKMERMRQLIYVSTCNMSTR